MTEVREDTGDFHAIIADKAIEGTLRVECQSLIKSDARVTPSRGTNPGVKLEIFQEIKNPSDMHI